MSDRNVDELMDELYSLVDRAWKLPMSGGRTVVDGGEVKQLLDELRENLPDETRQARAIVADRAQIIADAKREAEQTISKAEERARKILNQSEIVKQAQEQANYILKQGKAKFDEMKKASNEYVEDLMKRAEDALAENLAELRKTRQNIKASQRTSRNG